MHNVALLPPAVGTDDASYYRARALQEQVAAVEATSAAAQNCHDQLALMYRFRAALAERTAVPQVEAGGHRRAIVSNV